MKKIAIVGYGYVGKSMFNFFKDHYDVYICDPTYEKSNTKEEINDCDMAVVCVPTPQGETGAVDTTIVEEVIGWLQVPLILIKSTIPPKTTKGLKDKFNKRIVFSPEYIGEGKYQVQWWKDKAYPHPTDMKMHDFFIFGGDKEDTPEMIQYFLKVVGPDPKYIQTDSTTAELVKYMENSWGAMKVAFCNEFADIADTFDVNYEELREMWLLDGRVERMHTAVFRDQRGFGGKCFPKDVNGIIEHSIKHGYEPELLMKVIKRSL
ncbi:MAG: UDPglucose 6-dehydrogenase [Candidatus Paceibacteria bacterium]|jgi:UDPglucose 6-dehydrogenase